MKAGKHGIELDPNSWDDNLYWFEDEPEMFEFMRKNEDIIRFYAKKNGLSIKVSIDILYNLRVSK